MALTPLCVECGWPEPHHTPECPTRLAPDGDPELHQRHHDALARLGHVEGRPWRGPRLGPEGAHYRYLRGHLATCHGYRRLSGLPPGLADLTAAHDRAHDLHEITGSAR